MLCHASSGDAAQHGLAAGLVWAFAGVVTRSACPGEGIDGCPRRREAAVAGRARNCRFGPQLQTWLL